MDSAALFPPVREPSAEAREQFLSSGVSVPAGAGGLGGLQEPGAWLSACQGVHPPQALLRPRLLIFTPEQDEGIEQLVEQLNSGQSPLHSLAVGAGVGIRMVATSPQPAAELTQKQLENALELGRRIADEEIDSGADLLIPAAPGMATELVATALAGALTRTEPVVVVGAGYDISEEVWKYRVQTVRDAMFRVHADIPEPLEVMRKIASPAIIALAAFCAQAAARRTPVLVDGPVSTLTALLADRLAPGARAWFQSAQDSAHPVQTVALRDLGLRPLLELNFDVGPGSGALLALPLLQTAGQLAREAAGIEPEPN